MATDIEDFGFSFEEDTAESTAKAVSDIELLQRKVDDLQQQVENKDKVIREMYKKILVLLNNLKKNPEKPVIKWPNRAEAIEKFVTELNELRDKGKNDAKG